MVPGPLPPAVQAGLSESVRDYWLDRMRQSSEDFYAGIPLAKFPEDLRVYEHLLWNCRPNVVIEIGTWHGASALWFRDRLRTIAAYGLIRDPRVISVDVETDLARRSLAGIDPDFEREITLLDADVIDPGLPERVAAMLPAEASCLVVEDSRHVYRTTMAALEGFARFVSPGGFFVVEDGCVDVEEMRLGPEWPRGVLPAIRDWLMTDAGSEFECMRSMELYGITCHPEGFLRRRTGG